jgi:hypothetical protein
MNFPRTFYFAPMLFAKCEIVQQICYATRLREYKQIFFPKKQNNCQNKLSTQRSDFFKQCKNRL